jgi:hypothetical protein
MMEAVVASIHTRRKSRWNPSAVDAAIKRAAFSACGIKRWMPVSYDGQVVAAVRGDGRSAAEIAPLTHGQWCGFIGVDDLRQKIKAGKYTRVWFFKDNSLGGQGQ